MKAGARSQISHGPHASNQFIKFFPTFLPDTFWYILAPLPLECVMAEYFNPTGHISVYANGTNISSKDRLEETNLVRESLLTLV